MPISIVTDPQGKRHRVEHPEGASQESIFGFVEQQVNPQGRAPRVIDANDSFAIDVAKGLFAGGSQAAVSSAAGIAQWAGQTFQSEGMLEAAEDMRQYSQGIGENIGLDQNFRESFPGMVFQGLGQVPVTIGAGAVGLATAGPVGMIGAAALTTGGQMTSEFLTDMEQTVGKQYTDFNASEKDAALKGMLAQTALGTTLELAAVGKAVRPLLRRIKSGKGVSSKALKKAIEKDKGALREIVESGAAEGFTEASQGQSLDTLASLLYDDDRELLTMGTLKRRTLEFGVGSIVGGTVSGGSQILGSPGKTSTTEKDLGKPVEGRSEVSVPREIQVTYKPVDGDPTTVTLSVDEGEDAFTAAERILEGRRLPGSDMTVNEVIEQTPIDVVLGETKEDVLEEDVPVDPAPTPDPDSEPAPDLNVSYQDVIQDPEYLSKGKDIRDKLQRGEITLEEATNQDNALRRNIEARISRKQTATPTPTPEPAPAPVPVPGKTVAEYAQDLGITEQEFRAKFPPLAKQADERSAAPEPSVETAPESEEEIDAKSRIAALQQRIDKERRLIKMAQDENDNFIKEIQESKILLKEEQQDRIEKSNAKLKKQVDRRNKLIGTYEAEMSGLDLTIDPEPEEEAISFPLPQEFKISRRMARSTPKYNIAEVNYASDLELAVYIASGKGKNAGSVRAELIESGFSPAQIDAMSKDVRSQMRKQYNAGRPISVKISSDITAQASGVDRRTLSFKDVTKRTPEIQEQAKILKENIKSGDRQQSRKVAEVADEFKPVHAYDFVPAPETNSDMRTALNKNQVLLFNAVVPDGKRVAMRLDIPAYKYYGTWIPVIHEPKGNSFQAGDPLSYKSTGVLENVELGVAGKGSIAPLNIATGKDKTTIATIRGTYRDVTPTQAKKMADKALKDPSYVQVGMDPERRGYFYNRETMQEVVAGDQAIQVGPLVLVKNPVYGATPSNEYLSLGEVSESIENQSKNEKENTQEQSDTGATSAPAGNRLFSQPLQDATSVSERYQGTQGIREQEPRRIVELDEERAALIGKAYDKMKHDPKNPEVVRAYQALVKETLAQYDAILEDGYAMELSDTEYDNSQDMIEDVRNRKVMRVFSTEDGFGTEGITAKERRENPMLAESGRTDKNGKPLLVNDIFRFVHDFFGHGKLGNGFGPLGEENAWNVHSLMFSPLARRALTTETRGQNSWVNFSGVNDKAFEIRTQARQARADGDLKKAKRLAQKAYSSMRFAEQKIGLLPKEFSESNYQEDVTAQAAETAAEDRGPQDTFDSINQLEDFISKSFSSIADKMGINIYPNMLGQFVAQYNVSQKIIEYNPRALLNRTKAGVQAAMREEIIHAAMHNVLIQKEKKARTGRSEDALWVDFFTALGNNLTPQERTEIQNVYQSLQEGNAVAFGSEYSRAVVQKFRYGDFTEQYLAVDKGGPAFQAIVDLLRSVQAYMAKVLGPMVKTDPEAAQVIVDTVELLNAIDPTIRPKSQQVVANAYDATDKNTAEENTDPGESVDAKASERVREERKWFADSSLRKTASKYLTPVITRLNRINPMFGRLLQNLDTAIRERSFRYRKQTEPFFNRLNAIKGAEFEEMKQLLFFSPTPEEASRPRNKAKMQRRDALLHKYGLLNMYRLDVQPIMEEIYAEYTKLGMPAMGYLEDYFPRVVKDLEGLIKSYGQKTKRTFELLVEEENKRRSEIKEDEGGPLPEMEKTELARFFQDFLQNKFRVDINGARLPGNVKVRDIQLIPADKLKFYDDPGIAFGKYTANMARAIESFKVVGDTRKGKGSLQGELGELTEELFSAGQIDNADADTVKSLTELITTQFQTENEILKSLGTLTYMATLINPGPVLVQIMDLYKVALYRGLGGVVSGVYRTVTGNRRFDLEDDLSISKTQLSAEFQDASVLQKALDFGLSRLVPFRQMDTAMKHASIEAAYDDFLKKAKSPVGSKKYNQLLSELTITMGRADALKTIKDLQANKAMDSIYVKEALLAELLQRQPLTYLQVPEGYQTDPSKRLFYKLSTFMLLDLNYNRQEFMNDLGGPGKTLQQRTAALRRLTYMATLLTMFGLPSDMLDDWISGKDTYIPEHVMNNMLGMFGLSKYTTTRALEKGTVESVIQRFTPPAVNIIVKGEESLRSWVKGDVELFEMKAWRNSPLSDVWYNRTGAGKAQQEKLQKERRKEGVRPTFDR